MSYPAGWDLVNVTGTYIARDGVPCVGTVTFSSPQLVLRSGTIVPAADIVFTLNANGTFSGQVPATDDPNGSPTGWVYTITENVPGGRQGLQITAPHTSPGIDLSTVVPVVFPQPPTPNYQWVTLAQLQASAVGDGAYLVGYQNPGAGSVARTAQLKLQETVSVMDFGAKGDGVADDTAAIQAAITFCSLAAGPRRIYFPMGTYNVTSGFTINHPVRLVGEGAGSPAFEMAPAETGSHIKYTGAAGAVMFEFQNVNFGSAGMEGLWIDANNLASACVLIDNCSGGRWERVKMDNFTVYGMKLTATTGTCSWNSFDTLFFNTGAQTIGTKGALWLSGVTGGGNAAHNTFVNTGINHSGSFHGVYLGGCDNIGFLTTYIYRGAGGTGYGVYCDFSENGSSSAFPGANVFVHLEAMAGYFEPAAGRNPGSQPSAVIYGYNRDNGEPLPVATDGARIPLVDNAGSLYSTVNIPGTLTVTSGTTITQYANDTVFLNYGTATSVTNLNTIPRAAGTRVSLYQQSGSAAVTLVNGSAGTGSMFFKGNVNVTLAANNCVELMWQPSNVWVEVGRNF